MDGRWARELFACKLATQDTPINLLYGGRKS
jgi:hypothetical protein